MLSIWRPESSSGMAWASNACRQKRTWRPWPACFLLLSFAVTTVGEAVPGKVLLTRKYRPGRAMVYVTRVETSSKIDSEPPELKNFFPPLPTNLRLDQQSTVTVLKGPSTGAASVQHRFDKFEINTDLATLPEGIRDSVSRAQHEVNDQMVGQTLTAQYDQAGRLIDFDGADSLFRGIDAPVREPLLQMLRLFLEQMGGQSLYPDHAVKVGEEWSQKLDAQPLKNYPYQVRGVSTLHYAGKTKYRGVRAAIVDYHFENALIPALEGLQSGGALPQLQAMGMRLEIQISGKGEGRILLALDDGRVLQNHSTMHQTLSAVMRVKDGLLAPAAQVPRLSIESDTKMDVEGSKAQPHG
jgi:hypothetical protein